MRRLSFLLLAASLSMAASSGMAAGPLPLPPVPPAQALNHEPAPVPNSAVRGPVTVQSRGPELSPTMMGPKYTYQGEAFLPGSTVQSEQNRKTRPAPGLNLTVPLQ